MKMHKGKTKYMTEFNTDDSIMLEDQAFSRVRSLNTNAVPNS